MATDTEDGERRAQLGEPQAVHPPAMDVRTDLGALGDGPVQLFAPPALLPVPVELIPDREWAPPHPVVVGTPHAAAWRYACLAVTRRGATDLGTLEIGVSFEGEFALAGIETEVDRDSRPPRYWWLPAAQVWIERPVDDPPRVRSADSAPPDGPPLRMLSRATEAERVIGRHGWLARQAGWVPIVAVTDLWKPDSRVLESRQPRPWHPSPAPYLNAVLRRAWYRWGVIGDVSPGAVETVQASMVWLE